MDRLELGHCSVDLRQDRVHRGDQVTLLTTKEAQLLRYLAARVGQPVPREELLEQVWEYRPGVVSRAIDTTVRRLRRKLEVEPTRPAHLLTVTGTGYRLELGDARAAPSPALAPPAGPVGNLPPPPGPLVGRDEDLARLSELAQPGSIVTLLGPGGVGKTRLALELAHRHGAAWFCDLSHAQRLDDVLAAIARALAVPLTGAASSEALAGRLGDALAAQGDVVLLLDNFEGAVAHAAAVVPVLRRAAPAARLVATSQARLGLHAESVLDLGPLDQESAVALFAHRAAMVRPGFAVDDPAQAAELVALLDHLPLAIELAAARARMMSIGQITARLSRRFDLLRADRPDIAPRHRAMRAVLDASWELLSPQEQRVLAWCSVFVGGFSLEATERVLATPADDDGWAAVELVGQLMDRSLVRSLPGPDGAPRTALFETVRLYAAEHLDRYGEREQAERQHAEWVLDVGETLAEGLDSADGARCRVRLSLERDNLLAVHARFGRGWAEAALRAAEILQPLLATEGPHALMLSLFEDLASATGALSTDRFTRIVERRATAYWLCGRLDEALDDLDIALVRAQAAGDRWAEGEVMHRRAWVHFDKADMVAARADAEAALALHVEVGDHALECKAVRALGLLVFRTGDLDAARQRFEEALAMAREQGNQMVEGKLLGDLGLIAREQGRLETALRLSEQAVAALHRLDNPMLEANARINLSLVQALSGQLPAAIENTTAGMDAMRRVGQVPGAAIARGSLGVLQWLDGDLDAARGNVQASFDTLQGLGHGRAAAFYAAWLGGLLLATDPQRADALLAQAREMLAQAAFPAHEAFMRAIEGHRLVHAGDRAQARTLLDQLHGDAHSPSGPVGLAILLLEAALERSP